MEIEGSQDIQQGSETHSHGVLVKPCKAFQASFIIVGDIACPRSGEQNGVVLCNPSEAAYKSGNTSPLDTWHQQIIM